jgi:hypothetical protein
LNQLHPNRPFKEAFLGQLSVDEFVNPATGHQLPFTNGCSYAYVPVTLSRT